MKIKAAVDESSVDLFTLQSSVGCLPKITASGQIKGADKDFIYVVIDEGDFNSLQMHSNKQHFDIKFHMNRLGYQLQHRAIEYMEKHKLHPILINNNAYYSHCDEHIDLPAIIEDSSSEKLNHEQKIAVQLIVESNNRLPYLLFGPAGTGKTRTLVTAVENIVRSTNGRVLVCANSNAACDEFTERLLKVMNTKEIFRMYAKSYNIRNVSKEIIKCSNFKEGQFRIPKLKHLYTFRVVICTLLTAGCISRACGESDFNSAHFSHVIIDEAASTNETMTLIPIAGILFFIFDEPTSFFGFKF